MLVAHFRLQANVGALVARLGKRELLKKACDLDLSVARILLLAGVELRVPVRRARIELPRLGIEAALRQRELVQCLNVGEAKLIGRSGVL